MEVERRYKVKEGRQSLEVGIGTKKKKKKKKKVYYQDGGGITWNKLFPGITQTGRMQ